MSGFTFTVGETTNLDIGDRITTSGGLGTDLVVTAIDRQAGTFTVSCAQILKRMYAEIREEDYVFGTDRASPPVRLAGCKLGEAPTVGAVGAATIAVVTTVAAIEWLRRRKAQVAAAEGSEEAYRSLLSEFLIWLRRWLELCGWERKA